MAGLFDRLFGRKDNQPEGEYFLDQDSAKTLGDVEYMRKRKTIKHTFPKTADSPEGAEIVVEISSMEKVEKVEEPPKATTIPAPTFEPRPIVTPASEPKDGMDFFRKLAKDVRRR
jgi:hypothetical protein